MMTLAQFKIIYKDSLIKIRGEELNDIIFKLEEQIHFEEFENPFYTLDEFISFTSKYKLLSSFILIY